MREIKFRAWDTEVKKMDYSDALDDLERAYSWFYSLEDREVSDNIILMQYTGLKDKNGKEIYEGDIVQDYRNRAEVMWLDEGAGFIFATLDRSDWWAPNIDAMRDYEVIGNIYENGDLLNEKA